MASSKYSLLNNRYVLYFFLFLAIIDITYFINSGDMKSLMVFILITVLTSMFNKNMIVILCLSLVTTHLIKFGSKSYQEGMKNNAVKEGANSKLDMSDVDDDNEVVDNDEVADIDEKKMDKNMDKKMDKKIDKKMDKKMDKKTDDVAKNKNVNMLDEPGMDKKELQKKISKEIKKITPLINKYLDKAVPDDKE